MKQALSMIEFLIAITLMAFLGIYSMNLLGNTQKNTTESYNENLILIDLNATQNILYNRKLDNQPIVLEKKDDQLFLNNSLVLEFVKSFSKNGDLIDICLENGVIICQKWNLNE